MDTDNQIPTDDLETKRKAAMLAMEGTEHAAKREKKEKNKDLLIKKETIKKRLAEIAKAKADLELSWVKLDEERGGIKKVLDPIIKEEEIVEADETKTEEDERKMPLAREKQKIEKHKWEIEDKRRKVEEHKWKVEETIWQAEDAIDQNTKKYRALIDEEDKLNQELTTLDEQVA